VAVEVVQFKDSAFGGFFKPDDVKGAVAIVIEPTNYEENVPAYEEGKLENRVYADVSVFHDLAKLEAADPEVAEDMVINKSVLAKQTKDLIGKAVVVQVEKRQPKKGNAYWSFKPVDPQIQEQVEAYLEARESAANDLIG